MTRDHEHLLHLLFHVSSWGTLLLMMGISYLKRGH